MIKVPKVFPPKKNLTLFVPLHLYQTTKKKCQWKKNSMSLCLPRLTASHNVLLLCYHLVSFAVLLRPASCTIFRVLLMMSSPLMVSAFQQMVLLGVFTGGVIFDFPYLNLSLSYLYHYVIIYNRIMLCYYVISQLLGPSMLWSLSVQLQCGSFHSWLPHWKVFIMISANWSSL